MDEIKKVYRTEEVAVTWEPSFCIHVGNCIRGLPRVFDPRDRPWVHVDQAPPEEIAAVVMTCPTGALHFARLDGGPQEQPPGTTTVSVTPNGPLFLHGDIELRDATGELIRRDTRMALCRCGASENNPYCDNSHRRAGFRG